MNAETLTRSLLSRARGLVGVAEPSTENDIEQARAQRRRDVLERRADDRRKAIGEIDAHAASIATAKSKAERLSQQLATASGTLARMHDKHDQATTRLQRIEHRADVDLATLGGSAIEGTIFSAMHAKREAQSAMTWREVKDPQGRVISAELRSDLPVRQVAFCEGVLRELDALKTAPLAPAAVELRCAEIETAIARAAAGLT
jgi:hypothetical protein